MLQIGKLTCLQTLPYLTVGHDSCSGLKVLGPLLHLQDTLCILGLEYVTNHEDARDARLFEKKNLSMLQFVWRWNVNKPDKACELEIFDILKPHEGLKVFIIDGYGGTKFPI